MTVCVVIFLIPNASTLPATVVLARLPGRKERALNVSLAKMECALPVCVTTRALLAPAAKRITLV